MFTLIGIAPRDGWGLVKSAEGKFYVLRPPYRWSRCREPAQRRYVEKLVGRMYFIGCDEDFNSFQDVIKHLEAEYVRICKQIMGDRPMITEAEAKDLAKWLRSRRRMKSGKV